MSDGRSKPRYVSLRGELVAYEDANVHVLSTAFKYAATVYEGIRAYWSEAQQELAIFRLRDHLERLEQSAALSGMSLPEPVEEMERRLIELIRANELREDLHIRIIAYIAADDGLLDAVDPVELVYAAMPMGRYPERAGAGQELHVCISHWQRLSDAAMPPRVKTSGNYVNSRLALIQARRAGYDDALLTDREGRLTEGPGYNVFVVRDGVLLTPPVTQGILEGVTRDTLMRLAREVHDIEVAERLVDKTEAMIADEAFFCGSGKEVRPIASVDRHPLRFEAPGPITRALGETYFAVVRGERPEYGGWLLPVWSADAGEALAGGGDPATGTRRTE
jgi:branched-chain amino acid aminotransferase